MSKDFRWFARFAILAVVILWSIDGLLGFMFNYLERNMRGGERARTYYAATRAEADVIIFGSSRALYHYNPAVMREVLGMRVYNAGRSAQTVLYHMPLLKMILKRHTPKLIVLDINENEFVRDQQKYDIVNFLLPYYGRESAVREIVDKVKPSYKYFAWSKILPYNSSILSMVWRTLRPESEDKDGYAPVFGHRLKGDTLVHNCNESFDFDSNIIDAFDAFVQACQDANVPLMIIVSPRYTRFECERLDLARVSEEAAAFGVPLLDWSASEKFQARVDWMHDVAHLNYEGSIEFSRDVATYLKGNCLP